MITIKFVYPMTLTYEVDEWALNDWKGRMRSCGYSDNEMKKRLRSAFMRALREAAFQSLRPVGRPDAAEM